MEAGAFDGATDSNTLHFELAHQWSGLLVEPVKGYYARIADKGRRVWSANTCLSSTTKPQTVKWAVDVNSQFEIGRGEADVTEGGEKMPMQCFPLYTLLLALGNPTVDFLSLDVEGPELEVLETVPWAKVDIRAISVETEFLPGEKRKKLFQLLTSNGFTHLRSIARDDIFVRLPEGGQSPKQKAREVLCRRIPRLCPYFRVNKRDLPKYCSTTLPRDYFRPRTDKYVPDCVHRDQCRWSLADIAATIERNDVSWKGQLSDGCMFVSSDGSQSADHPRLWALENL